MLVVHMRRHTGEKPHKCTVRNLSLFSEKLPGNTRFKLCEWCRLVSLSCSLRAVPRPTPVWKTLKLTYARTPERNRMCVNTKAATRPFPMPQTGRNTRIAHTQTRYWQTWSRPVMILWLCWMNVFLTAHLSPFIFRNHMCAKSQAAPNATRILAPYASTWRRCTDRRRTSPRNSVEITRVLHHLGATARAGRRGKWVVTRTKGSTTMLPQNRMNVCRSSLSRQRSLW